MQRVETRQEERRKARRGKADRESVSVGRRERVSGGGDEADRDMKGKVN